MKLENHKPTPPLSSSDAMPCSFSLLDLYCCAGGAGEGYRRAGFDVTGVDINPQPRNPHRFIQGDALEYLREHGHKYDAIHASPPCQAHTAMKTMHNAKKHEDLIPATRELLIASGKPWIMENVVGAPMNNPVTLCGTMFGLGFEDAELRRHRLFETSFFVMAPPCYHGSRQSVIGVYGGHLRNRRRIRTIGIYGKAVRDRGMEGRLSTERNPEQGGADWGAEQGREAMGINWMSLAELCQAIPPAYTEFLGRALLSQMKDQVEARRQ